MTIGLFGGSFDPIHHGHLLVAQAVTESLGLEELRFVPAREQPFKIGRHSAPAETRARMVALAIAGEPRFTIERIELERAGPSYTVDTVRALRELEPDREFAVLVGADAARDLEKWHEVETLAELASFVIFRRPGAPVPSLPWRVRLVQVPAVDISATAIRQRVASGRSIRYWVPDAVAECIVADQLYLPHA
jgi:nicotinate-nucleotide adenylyltransferase